MKKIYRLSLFVITLQTSIFGQDKIDYQKLYQLHIKPANEKIIIDGMDNELSWSQAEMSTNFWEKYPSDQQKAKRQTEIKALYDNQFVYFFLKMYDTSSYVIQTLKRDNGFFDSDAISIALDPVNAKTNGFVFSVNPYNVQSEDLISSSGNMPNFSWDNKWISQTKRMGTYWTVEIAIPFKTLRYEAGKTVWGINFLRTDIKNYQYSSWTHMPNNFMFYDFGYLGSLIWDKPPPQPGTNLAFIPYLTGGINQNKEAGTGITNKLSGGFDAKVAVTSSLNLDITVNPDFSQVEVDKQVTNLTRFNIFFPERRTFFLENNDLFSEYGIDPIRPFYSRKIGLDNEGKAIPIAGGFRLSGNLDKKTRIGVMNMQTLKKGNFDAQNYSAVSFNRRVFQRSLVKGYFLNRNAVGNSGNFKDPLDAYGRNSGLEYNYSDVQGKWNVWSGFHQSFKPGITNERNYINLGWQFQNRNLSIINDFSDIGKNFYTDMGFVQRIENYDAKFDTTFRVGFRHLFSQLSYKIIPVDKKIIRHEFEPSNYIVFNRDGTLNERNTDFNYTISFKKTNTLMIQASNYQSNLLYYTPFTNADPLPPGKYIYSNASVFYESDIRKKFIYNANFGSGAFYNGTILQWKVGFTYRIQPFVNFNLSIEQAKLKFPGTYGTSNLLLIAPRVEVNFSNSLFWTTFLQYNNQNNNFNINSRMQWRFKPMSDLYLVYTDNYFTTPFMQNKNRALVFKLNYWFNL